MKIARTIVVLAVLFVAGFVGARVASRPPAPEERLTSNSANSDPAPKSPRVKSVSGGGSVGFASEVASLQRFENAFARGDYESLLEGEQAQQAAHAWAKNDPVGMWEWRKENEDSPIWNGGLYGTLITSWFKRDPKAALNAWRQLGDTYRWSGRRGLVTMLFSDDPELSLLAGQHVDEFLGENLPDGDSGTDSGFYGGLASLEKLKALPESRAKEGLLRTAMAGWARVDWKAARDWAATRPDAERAAMERGLFAWGFPRRLTGDPEGLSWAAEWLAREENRDMRIKLGSSLVGVMARKDPVQAMAWADAHLPGTSRAGTMSAIVAAQVRKDPQVAIEIVEALPPGRVRERAGRALIANLRQTDPSAAYERALTEERAGIDIGSQTWGQVGTMLAIKKPGKARAVLKDLPENLPLVFKDRLLSHLAISHPKFTLDWAALELEGERRAAIMDRMLRSWRVHDPVAAEKWERARTNAE